MDNMEYDNVSDKGSKKSKKKEKNKDKGYATLADDNSQDEGDHKEAPSSSGKKTKLKGFKLPSASSSAKKGSKEKEAKDKDKEKTDKELKKDAEKELKKLEKEKHKVKHDVEKERERSAEPIPFSSARMPFSAERHSKELSHHHHRSSVPIAFFASLSSSSEGKSEKEKESTGERERAPSSGLNAFLNAPAPLFLQKKAKDKEKKEKKKDKEKEKKEKKEKEKEKQKKEGPSGVAKVKLKLMRSKNSLDEPQHSDKEGKDKDKGDIHVSVSHQFPEDPEALAKEIKKYEQLLEQTHAHIKSSKKVSKKHEEQLWELQRTLTALKRKLRSINVLSTASVNLTFPVANASSAPGPPSGPSSLADSQVRKVEVTPMASPEDTLRMSSPKEISAASKSQDIIVAEPAMISTIPPPPIPGPKKSTARRSLEFTDAMMPSSSKKEGPSPSSPPVSTQVIKEVEPELQKERETLQVEVLVHNNDMDEGERNADVESSIESEEREEDRLSPEPDNRELEEDSSLAPSEDEEDETVLTGVPDDHIGAVVNDTNAMIGSMHEELEAAALEFGQLSSPTTSLGKSNRMQWLLQNNTNVSKSEPTFGVGEQDSSDVELIRDDEDDEDDDQDDDTLVPYVLSLPEFNTVAYLTYENEQFALFNQLIQEEIAKEEAHLELLIQDYNHYATNEINETIVDDEDEEPLEEVAENDNGATLSNQPGPLESERGCGSNDDDDAADGWETLADMWKEAKTENVTLHANIVRLRQMVVQTRLEEFKLETRLRFLENVDKLAASPTSTTITSITPLVDA